MPDRAESNHAEAPTTVALRSLTRARRALEGVITGSESFDYPKAKQALKELDLAIRELAREEARLRSQVKVSSAQIIEFPLLSPNLAE